MVETHTYKTFQIYLTLENGRQFQLDKINKTEDYFIV